MQKNRVRPDYIFEVSWEVCHKVGGIYTVLSSHANVLGEQFPGRLFFIGPDLKVNDSDDFIEDDSLFPEWTAAFHKAGLSVRMGRWESAGNANALLVDFSSFYSQRNQIYTDAWNLFRVDSLHAYGDYDEASLFAYAAGRVVEVLVKECLPEKANVVYQAHEWMSGLGMLFLKNACPQVATVFTTHATSIGRSITSNGKELYRYFKGYNGDQMASELNMEAKHSVEKQSAWHADCFTTVSEFTNIECEQLLGKRADCVLPNGFDSAIVPSGIVYTQGRNRARAKVIEVAEALTGHAFAKDTLIVSTSGRNDFRCKGMDAYVASLRKAADLLKPKEGHEVIALIEVPCWTKQVRTDLTDRLARRTLEAGPLPAPFITHELFNPDSDQIVSTLRYYGMTNEGDTKVYVILVPCYLDGKDDVFNLPYYELLLANDLTLYPSYYEPWGYTPLESCAFRVPTITTDLSGFGQWVKEVTVHTASLENGVIVVERDDDNFEELTNRLAKYVVEMSAMSSASRQKCRRNASRIAQLAHWNHFIQHYLTAYSIALSKN